ncbi:28S ribosomal protein S29, mitochondrial [Myotis brandtii]|uniref:Small ribosomal subunit protein mS29 n=1 Tax=Myotis brandtii TaxID=109478 RepID=S7MVQ1_MYOBR|nr:28S ribosomal protein S29, mitochondrial [Myotis brandtii]
MAKGDPKKPRGKMSAYAFFVQTCREEHKEKNPEVPVNFVEMSKTCSERWKTMSAKEKSKFDEMAKADKVHYDREMKDYGPAKGGKKKKDPNAPKRPPVVYRHMWEGLDMGMKVHLGMPPQHLDPGHFLRLGTQAPQSLAAHLDNQVSFESPRAISCTSENDPMKTFNEACLMVRKPALELLHYLKNTNFAHPAVRYVLYGEKGTGKTLSLCHIIHFCAKQDWLILHIPDAHLWVKDCRDLLQSSYNKQRFDQPLEASVWLKNFKTTNERFLSQIKIQEKYVWNKRESIEKGSSLGEVVEQGITRVRNATDAVGIVLKELKRQSSLGTFHLLVAVDGVNALWGRTTLKREDKSPIAAEELALIHNLRKMVKNDWNGGAIVMTLSQTGSLFKPRKAYLPQELLGKEGFDALDPFIPILVGNYNPKEFESCIQYYLENSWLQHEKAHTEEGKKELLFLSNGNPGQLERLCAYL